jgi:hypothetical protein
MSDITEYTGESVKAFKKVNPSDLKFTPMQLNKTFYMHSGSTDTLHTPLQCILLINYIRNIILNWGEQNSNWYI